MLKMFINFFTLLILFYFLFVWVSKMTKTSIEYDYAPEYVYLGPYESYEVLKITKPTLT